MSRKKDLFKSQNPNKIISSADFDKLSKEVESAGFIKEKIKQQKMFTPKTDFSKPANFAKYGLAEEYYQTSVENIYKTYPYDGSRKEKETWYNNASYLDQYIFDNEYPRTNGYIIIGPSQTWGSSTVLHQYGLPSNVEYITLNGGPHKAFDPQGERTGSLANIFKSSKNRENNLKVNLEDGLTVEFWMKKGVQLPALTEKEVVFDLWNGEPTSSSGYGRVRLEMTASVAAADPRFIYTVRSGSTGPKNVSFSPSLTSTQLNDNEWHHYAFSFVSSSGGLVEAKFYRDGQFYGKNTTGTAFSSITGTMSASIGALRTGPQETRYHGTDMTGYGKLVDTRLDEFRYWKKQRTPKQIYDNYNFQVGGGTNTDDTNTSLGVYYKFNEGVSNNLKVDSVVLDYSGRVSNGKWIGYSSGARVTSSCFVEATASLREFKDPIIYSFHPAVKNVKNNLSATGSLYDRSNNAALFNTVPTWILEEDESYGNSNLKNLTQIMASYLDTLYLQTEELTKLDEVEYTSGSLKPNVFGDRLLGDRGLIAPELFVNADIVEQLYSRNDKTNFEKELPELKNKIYENVYNNLVNIYKSKGTYHAFRNVLNTLGISQKIVDIKMHANNAEYEILDNRKQVLERKKKLNLFKTSHNDATVYQSTGSSLVGVPQSLSYIPSAGDLTSSFTPWTMECRFSLPKDNINSNYNFINNNYITCSLFGYDRPHDSDFNDYTWATTNNTSVHVYAIRDKSTHKDGYFYLSSSNEAQAGTILTSSVISNLFNDTEWNVAVRFLPVKDPIETLVSGGTVPGLPSDPVKTFYKFDFKGASLRGGVVDEQFLVTSSHFDHSDTGAGKFYSLMNPRRVYIGAHRLNWTGSIYKNSYSWAKFHNFNYWLNNVSDADIVSHLKDSKNYGLSKTYQSSDDSFFERGYQKSLYDTNGDGVPNIDTLALRYDFETVTGSDANGQFVIEDTTTAGDPNYKYGAFGALTKQYQYPARGDYFDADSAEVVKTELINSYKLFNIDSVISDDMVQIRTQDDEVFLPDMRPEEYFFSVEKNFYNAVNESILETFSTLKDFNNLIGDPANRYRPEYKDLQKYKQLFFERVQNDLDFERFIEYYKWIDTSISSIISQLMPASADFSPNLSNVVESHILERNKFQHKLPVIKPQTAYSGTLAMTEHANQSNIWNKNPDFTRLKDRPENFAQYTPISSKEVQMVSSGSFSTIITASLQNLVDLTYRKFNTPTYVSGAENLNIINVRRTKPKFKKGPNFSEAYSQVMIPNKDGNNPFIFDSPFDAVADVVDSFVVSGVVDYLLPTRPNLGNFITPRFSAPGGPEVNSIGNLDYETTQYSPYNNINYRNLIVRKALEEMRLSASMDPTLFIDASDAASFNENYRNPRRDFISGTAEGTNLTGTFYNTAFISYPIPASTLQTSWITASYSTSVYFRNQVDSDDITFNQRYELQLPNNSSFSTRIAKNFPVINALVETFVSTASLLYSPRHMDLLKSNLSALGGGVDSWVTNQLINRSIIMTYSPYTYPTFEQIRVGQKPVARALRKGNVLSINNPIKLKEELFDLNGVGKKRTYMPLVANTFENFVEPPMTKRYKPLKHTFVLNNDSNDVVEIKTSYASMLAGFANRELNPRFRGKSSNVVENYESVKNLYLNSPDPDASPIKGWISIDYAEGIWPKEKFEGINSHRDKTLYDTKFFAQDDTLKLAFNKTSRLASREERTFWRDEEVERIRSNQNYGVFTNAQNSLGGYKRNMGFLTSFAGDFLSELKLGRAGSNFATNVWPLSDYGLSPIGSAEDGWTTEAANTGSLGKFCQILCEVTGAVVDGGIFAFNGLSLGVSGIYGDYDTPNPSLLGSGMGKGPYYTVNFTADGTARSFTQFSSSTSANSAQIANSIVQRVNGHPALSNILTASLTSGSSAAFTISTRYPIGQNAEIKEQEVNPSGKTLLFDTENHFNKLDVPAGIFPGGVDQPLTGGTPPDYNRNGELNSSFLALPEMNYTIKGGVLPESCQAYREEGFFGTHRTGSEQYPGITDRNATPTDPHIQKPIYASYFPKASQTFIHRPRVPITAGGGEIAPYNGHPWLVSKMSGRTPFQNSYQEYVDDIKILSDAYSIIPEFNFADHVSYYLDEKNGDFRAPNKKMFDITGISGVSSSATSRNSVYDAEFHKKYVYSEFLQQFDAVQLDHSQVGKVGQIKLTCKGIKKFRPQQGFYPVQRCVQMGTLLSGTLVGQLTGSRPLEMQFRGYDSDPFNPVCQYKVPPEERIQSAIQPLFSPGILYNSIKSGIAVDWPIVFSGSLQVQGNRSVAGTLLSSSAVISSEPSKRIPFEALADLDKGYPARTDVLYLYPSFHSATISGERTHHRSPYHRWTGKRSSNLYEDAMNNFLAEVPRFFLQNENFVDIQSTTEKDFKPFESGKTYYMDVTLSTGSNFFMWQDYYDGTVADTEGTVKNSRNGRAFGPGWVTNPGEHLDVENIGIDPQFAPYTPPYFYGEDIVRLSFTPGSSRAYTLDEIVSNTKVEHINTELYKKIGNLVDTGPAWHARMTLTSSVNLFEKIIKPKISIQTDPVFAATLTEKGNVNEDLTSITALSAPEGSSAGQIQPTNISLDPTTTTDYNAWRIVPKFECPVLNYTSNPSYTYMSRGVWGGLGEVPLGQEGIFLGIKESFTGSINLDASTGSLAKQLGFPIKKSRVGEIGNSKVLSEAIIAIPFLERKNNKTSEAQLTTIEKHNFFKVERDILEEQLRKNKNTSITRMAKKMNRYVIPPNLNFLKFKDISPFVMYVFEFEKTFSQEDLKFMWQGVMPEAAMDGQEEFDEIQVTHKTGPEEFFHGKEVPSDIRWIVFKAKKKARKSYSDVINLTSKAEQDYGYNWPYDYCSLVEMAKLEVDLKITPKEDVIENDMPIGKVLKGE